MFFNKTEFQMKINDLLKDLFIDRITDTDNLSKIIDSV